MVVAMILAGGSGIRMGAPLPKQFLRVGGKTILAHTLDVFQRHPLFDAIEVVCVEGYESLVWEEAERFGITKLRWVVAGGASGQDSAMNGVFALEGALNDDDILFEHMAVNPLIDNELIDDAIAVCRKYGNAVTTEYPPYLFPVRVTGENESIEEIPRKSIALFSMPMVTTYGKALELYKRGKAENVCMGDQHHITSLLMAYGEPVHFCKSSRKNIKLTTKEDIDFFEAYLMLREKKGGENCNE